MSVIEYDLDGIAAYRVNAEHVHVLLADMQHFLPRAMAAHFC